MKTNSVLGAFGVVSLVREQSTGGLYAMKQVIFIPVSVGSQTPTLLSCENQICCAKAKKGMSVQNATFSSQPPW